jgi:hypothetical protein
MTMTVTRRMRSNKKTHELFTSSGEIGDTTSQYNMTSVFSSRKIDKDIEIENR